MTMQVAVPFSIWKNNTPFSGTDKPRTQKYQKDIYFPVDSVVRDATQPVATGCPRNHCTNPIYMTQVTFESKHFRVWCFAAFVPLLFVACCLLPFPTCL